jgi:hypothetical protein
VRSCEDEVMTVERFYLVVYMGRIAIPFDLSGKPEERRGSGQGAARSVSALLHSNRDLFRHLYKSTQQPQPIEDYSCENPVLRCSTDATAPLSRLQQKTWSYEVRGVGQGQQQRPEPN